MISIISFYLIIQLLGWAAWPIAFRLFRWLPERGYIFSKALGLLLVSYLLWLGASTGLLRNDIGGALAALIIVAAISTWLTLRGRETNGEATGAALQRFLKQQRTLVVIVEALFLVAFLAWAALRAYATFKIASAGGEKFMEIAFLNGILESPQFPPNDPWLSGFAISYYYFGYVMMALMTRLTGALPSVAFDLYDAELFALTVTGSFGVLYNLIPAAKETLISWGRLLTGLLGSIFVAMMGNLATLVEALYSWGKLPASFFKWVGIPNLLQDGVVTNRFAPGEGPWFWWWRTSRVIQDRDLNYNPIGNSPITEFPAFSFLLGDNHPHVLALPFVLLAIALALNLLLKTTADRRPPTVEAVSGQPSAVGGQSAWWNPIAHVFDGDWSLFGLYAVCLGALIFLNTWDYPVYLALTLLAFGVGRYALTRRVGRELWGGAAALGLGLGVAGLLGYVFFLASFRSQAGGIVPYVFPPTRFVQFFVFFGPFLVILVFFLLAQASGRVPLKTFFKWWGGVLGVVFGAFLLLLLLAAGLYTLAQTSPAFQRTFENLTVAIQQYLGDAGTLTLIWKIIAARLREPELYLLLTAMLALAGAGVLWVARRSAEPPVQDEPTESAPGLTFALLLVFLGVALALVVEFVYLRDNFGVRMNTVFKFYYQVWALLALGSAYAVWWALNRLGIGARVVFAILVFPFIAAGLLFPRFAYPDRAEGFNSQPNLDGASSIAWTYTDDWAGIEWLRANADRSNGAPVILEAVRPDLGFAYSYEGRISAFTGFPAVLGWSGHEGQWRGSYDEQARRMADISIIYSTRDAAEALRLLNKWQVKYVILGRPEMDYIAGLCSDPAFACDADVAVRKFERVLTPVFVQGTLVILEVP